MSNPDPKEAADRVLEDDRWDDMSLVEKAMALVFALFAGIAMILLDRGTEE